MVTFMLPTRNRVAWVARAVRSCLEQASGSCGVRVLVIDGNSTDGTWEKLVVEFGQDSRVVLHRQGAERGFVGACLEAVGRLNSAYAGLIFDDDVLLPNYRWLLAVVLENKSLYGFGFGRLGALEQILQVPEARGFWEISPRQLLDGYLGLRGKLGPDGYPQSPMCGVFSADLWREWAQEIRSFCAGSPWRSRCMIKRSAGPDFLIYFLALCRAQGPVPVLDGVVTQFSRHEGTLTSALQERDLPTGYWLSFFWLHRELLRQGRYNEAADALVHQKKKIRRLRRRWDREGRAFLDEELRQATVQNKRAVSLGTRWRAGLRGALPRVFRFAPCWKTPYRSVLP
jgi:glycosyltransferase involved in cell wall biosynthesis